MHRGGVALFGGTFNPIHVGHLVCARAIREYLDLSRVIFIPAAYPPHRWTHELVAPHHRLEMVRLAIAGEPHFEASDVELQQGGMTYSLRSAATIRQTLGPQITLYWIIGGDALLELKSWQRLSDLVEMCRIVTAVRPGFEVPDLSPLLAVLTPEQVGKLRDLIIPTPRLDVSATEIRWRVRENRSIRYLVPDAVREYILGHGLYHDPPVRGASTTRSGGPAETQA